MVSAGRRKQRLKQIYLARYAMRNSDMDDFIDNSMHNFMDNIQVLHQLKSPAGVGLDTERLQLLAGQGLVIDTCLRQVVILLPGVRVEPAWLQSNTERMQGQAAYRFLLQTVTGLNSAIPGETNVQGQFRHAWDQWRDSAGRVQVSAMAVIMHRLLADSRQIRRDHLQGIGGTSYGTLVRKLLPDDPDSRILFVGAGALARSMLPLFSAFSTAIWNRHAVHSDAFNCRRVFGPAAAEEAACWASALVITTPPDNHNDALWVRMADANVNTVVHLGRRRAAWGPWSDWAQRRNFLDLDDLFALRARQAERRSAQLLRARRACTELATGLALPHDGFSVPALAQHV